MGLTPACGPLQYILSIKGIKIIVIFKKVKKNLKRCAKTLTITLTFVHVQQPKNYSLHPTMSSSPVGKYTSEI